MKFDKKTYLAFGFLILLVLIFVLNKKVPLTPKNTVDSSEFIVQLSSSVGKVSFRSGPNSAQNTTPNYPENLLNKSELKTYEGSKAQLSFENGWVIDLNENSLAQFQVWNGDEQEKYLLHILNGSYELITKGDEEGIIVLYKNNFYTPGAELADKASLNMEIIASQILNKDLKVDETNKADEQPPLPEPSLSDEEVSTRYIEVSILKKRHLFEKCLANRIRENNLVNGRLLVGFHVTEMGTLKDINIIENKTQDKKIEACILDVFAGIKIRNYNGPKTFFAFPVDFK